MASLSQYWLSSGQWEMLRRYAMVKRQIENESGEALCMNYV